MFKRVSKSIKRKEKEDKLGISEIKQRLRDEAGSNAEASSSGSGSDEDEEDDASDDESEDEDMDGGESMSGEGESDSEDDDESDEEGAPGDQANESSSELAAEEDIPVSIGDCLDRPIYKLPTPEGVDEKEGSELAGWSCALCPNKIFANEHMTQMHVASKAHVRAKLRMTEALSRPSTLPETLDPRVIALSILDDIAAKQLASQEGKVKPKKGGAEHKMTDAERKAAKKDKEARETKKREVKQERKAKFLAERAKNGSSADAKSDKNTDEPTATGSSGVDRSGSSILSFMLKAATEANLPVLSQLEGRNRKKRKKMLVSALTAAGIPVSESKEKGGKVAAVDSAQPQDKEVAPSGIEEAVALDPTSTKVETPLAESASTPKSSKPRQMSKRQEKKRKRNDAAAEAESEATLPIDPTFDNGADFISLTPQKVVGGQVSKRGKPTGREGAVVVTPVGNGPAVKKRKGKA